MHRHRSRTGAGATAGTGRPNTKVQAHRSRSPQRRPRQSPVTVTTVRRLGNSPGSPPHSSHPGHASGDASLVGFTATSGGGSVFSTAGKGSVAGRHSALSHASLYTDSGSTVTSRAGKVDQFVRMRRAGSSLMKGCVRYQNALDHVEKSIAEVTKQIEATRQATGGADHTMLYVQCPCSCWVPGGFEPPSCGRRIVVSVLLFTRAVSWWLFVLPTVLCLFVCFFSSACYLLWARVRRVVLCCG